VTPPSPPPAFLATRLPEGKAYQAKKISDDAKRAGYYIELDLIAEAERTAGADFAKYLQKNHEPTEPLFRLAEETGVVLLNCGGFDGPEWSLPQRVGGLDQGVTPLGGAARSRPAPRSPSGM